MLDLSFQQKSSHENILHNQFGLFHLAFILFFHVSLFLSLVYLFCIVEYWISFYI